MSNDSMDNGVIKVLLDRFNEQRLPLLLELKERVYRGEKLNVLDVKHLEDIAETARQISPALERHPEFKPLVAQVIGLYKEITSKALENEQKS
jgi:hypothetical protein